MNRLVIIGAGGHGKVIADIAVKSGYTDISFLDDHIIGDCMGFPIRGTSCDVEAWNDTEAEFVIAVGNNAIRKRIFLENPSLNYVSLVHPSAIVGRYTQIGRGTVVMAGAVINPCSRIGMHCIVNSGAIVEHDNVLEDFVHLSPRATLGGTVFVGENSHIGIGAAVRNNITICGNCIIGAGAAVVKNIKESGVYVGVPCTRVK